MTREMLDKLHGFEIFVEKLEEVIEELKRTHLCDVEGHIYHIDQFDLRDDQIGQVDSIPKTIEDYARIWNYVEQRYKEYLDDYNNTNISSEMFFDVYWNGDNAAFYDDLTLWINFDYEYGIYYNEDTDIIEKIRLRDERTT